MKPSKLRIIILLLIFIVLQGSPVFAHRMIIEEVDDGLIQVFYENGNVSRRTEVVAYDEQGNEMVRGPLDGDGLFAYDPEKVILIVADDGLGHRAELILGEEIGQALPRVPTVIAVLGVFVLIAGLFHYRINKRESGEDS
jgi:nickel transport protein